MDSGEDSAPAPRQLTSVKSDLIVFSPGKETAAPAPAAEPSVPPPPAAPAPAAAPEGSVAQQLKKQELYFQDQVRREGIAVTGWSVE